MFIAGIATIGMLCGCANTQLADQFDRACAESTVIGEAPRADSVTLSDGRSVRSCLSVGYGARLKANAPGRGHVALYGADGQLETTDYAVVMAAVEHEQCLIYGYTPRTAEYPACRMFVAGLRSQAEREAAFRDAIERQQRLQAAGVLIAGGAVLLNADAVRNYNSRGIVCTPTAVTVVCQ